MAGLTGLPPIRGNNLMIYYDFTNKKSYNRTDGNNVIIKDLSGNGYNGITNTTKGGFKFQDKTPCFDFQKTSTNRHDASYIEIQGLNYVTGEDDAISELTIETWIRIEGPGNTSTESVIASFDRSAVWRLSVGDSTGGSSVPLNTVSFSFAGSHGQSDVAFSNANFNIVKRGWVYLALTFKENDSEGLKLYLNGDLKETVSTVGKYIGNQTTTETPRYGFLGAGSEATEAGGTVAPTNYLNGRMASFKYWHSVLSAGQIRNNYLSKGNGLKIIKNNIEPESFDNYILVYDFSNPDCYPGTGTSITDLAFVQADTATVVGATYENNNHFTFDGVNDEIQITNSTTLNEDSNKYTEKYSEAWFKTHDINKPVQVIYEQGGTTNGINMYIYSGSLYQGMWSNSTGWNGNWRSASISENTWYHAAIVYSGSNASSEQLKFYLNGNLYGSASAGSQLSQHAGDVVIGNADNGGQAGISHLGTVNTTDVILDQGVSWFSGSIAYFATSNSSRTDAEVLADFNTRKSRFGY
jgi:hypothetical protein